MQEMQEKNWEEIKLLIEKILFHIREKYEVIDELLKLLFPFKSNEEVAEKVIEEVKSLNSLQLAYYLRRLENFAEFLLLYFLSEMDKEVDRYIEKINEILGEKEEQNENYYN